MSSGNYRVADALALGQHPALGDLKWRQGLCGQVLDVNCGHSTVQAIVSDICDLGTGNCGLDLILRTWNTATNHAEPGVTSCSVTLPKTNPLNENGMQCFHRPDSDIGNEYFIMLGVLNTDGRIASSAKLAGITGTRANDNWFRFSGNGKPLFVDSAVVTFGFEDGSSRQFKIRECRPGGAIHVFQ